MMNSIDPRTLMIVQQEKERELERQIAYRRDAKVMRGYETGREQRLAWYAQAAQWMQVKLLRRAATSPQQSFEEPCPGMPC